MWGAHAAEGPSFAIHRSRGLLLMQQRTMIAHGDSTHV